jgi:secreted PhoX family phosphatase
MLFLRKPLLGAMMLGTLGMLAACGSDDGSAGISGRDGDQGSQGSQGSPGVDSAAGSDGEDAYIPRVEFSEVALPESDAAKRSIQSSTDVMIDGVSQPVSFTRLMATGDTNNGEIFGLSKDISGNVIQFEDASNYLCNGTNDGVGSGLDYVSIIQKHDKLFMVAQFECQIGSMYSAELDQTAEGVLSVKVDSLQFVDQSNEFGGWVHCAGQTTPWQSHLGSEEYEPDAAGVEAALASATVTGSKYYDEAALYHSTTAERAVSHASAKEAGIQRMSPYFVGWTPEVTILDGAGTTQYVKHYSMGRFSHELAYVMPDQKTVYLSDDGTNVGFFMFIADTKMDLSAGTLYAAKWIQTSDANGGRALIDWVSLGHSDNATVKSVINKDLSFSDVFDTDTPVNQACTDNTFTYAASFDECLKVKDIDGLNGVDAVDKQIASRLETRRYATMMGATLEFRKEEGITFDADNSKVYVAMSAIEKGMEDGASQDLGGNNDIRLPKNSCGAVYAMDVLPVRGVDTNGDAIDSRFVVGNMNAIITGTPDTSIANNACDVNGISNPDNVTYLQGSDVLVIGEDTSKHENNMIWALNVKSNELTRMMTTPLDAETTSPFWYRDVNGFGYMTAVAQHPMGGEADATSDEKQSEVGVIGPIDFTQLQK